MAGPTTYAHPQIGQIKGLTHDGILQFRGLQYATLGSRFAPAQLMEYATDKKTAVDATKLGPQVLSVAGGPEAEFGLIQHDLPHDASELSMSDTEGLCLNITIPEGALKGRKLPVFVFIHGGGFMVGSGCWPQYSMRSFVRLSVGVGKPVVAVVLNYRLGAPGLLTSSSPAWRQAGFKPNNSLRDQRTALQWVKKYIAGFGGDHENVTLAGESVGGVSVCYHLFGEERLFSRWVSMSGTHLLLPPLTAEAAEGEFRKAVKALGIEEGKEVEALEKMDGDELIGKLMAAGIRLAPVVDEDLVPASFDFRSFMAGKVPMPGLQWCQGAMIGDCQFDGNIRGLDLASRKPGIASAFHAHVTSAFSSSHQPDVARRWLSAYDITPSIPDDAAFESVLQVANDLNFYTPTLLFREYLRRFHPSLPTPPLTYRFNVPNPWPGAWKGRATHILDISFLFQNFNDYLGDADRAVARKFGEDVITFVNGEAAWSSTGMGEDGEEGTMARVYGADGEVKDVRDTPEETGRRDIMRELAAGEEGVGWDRLNEVFARFCKPGEGETPAI